jgi:hypothetical protein
VLNWKQQFIIPLWSILPSDPEFSSLLNDWLSFSITLLLNVWSPGLSLIWRLLKGVWNTLTEKQKYSIKLPSRKTNSTFCSTIFSQSFRFLECHTFFSPMIFSPKKGLWWNCLCSFFNQILFLFLSLRLAFPTTLWGYTQSWPKFFSSGVSFSPTFFTDLPKTCNWKNVTS